MDNRTIAEIDISDSQELRKYEARMYNRLLRLGFRLSKGEVQPTNKKRRLIREPKQRGYRITDASSGNVILGGHHEITLEQVNDFWQQKDMEQQAKQQKVEAERHRTEAKISWEWW